MLEIKGRIARIYSPRPPAPQAMLDEELDSVRSVLVAPRAAARFSRKFRFVNIAPGGRGAALFPNTATKKSTQ